MTDIVDATTAARLLEALTDILIPGDAEWPGAATVGAQFALASRLLQERGEDTLANVIEALRPASAALFSSDENARTAAVAAWEARDAELFGWVRDAVYLAYYESPLVVQAINAHGHVYKLVPHVTGYRLARFDPQRDTPSHGRGGWMPTDAVRRVDVETLLLTEQRAATWGRKQ